MSVEWLCFLGPAVGIRLWGRSRRKRDISCSYCLISNSRTQVVVERSICIHGGWRWIHLCGEEGMGSGEEGRKRGIEEEERKREVERR